VTGDRYDALERLQRLHQSGALTDSEFELEKKRLLGESAAPPSPLDPEAVAEDETETETRRNRTIAYLIVGGVGLIVAILLGLWLGQDVSGGNSAPQANVTLPQAPPPEQENLIAPVPPTNVRALPNPEQLSRAFATAFGTSGRASLQVAGRTINYKPAQFFWTGDRGVLISTGTAADDCHACAGTLAIHYLEAAGDGFKVTGAWPDAVPGEGYGAPPRWKLTSQFTAAPAIFEEGGYTGQGCTSGGVTITELAPEGPIRSGPIRTIYSMAGAVLDADSPGGDIEGKIANVQKDVGFDVNYSGDQPFTEHWVKKGTRFVLESGETRMPQC
jgi:hypothetical protein